MFGAAAVGAAAGGIAASGAGSTSIPPTVMPDAEGVGMQGATPVAPADYASGGVPSGGEPEKGKRSPARIAIAAGLVLVVLGVGAYLLFGGKKNSGQDAAATSPSSTAGKVTTTSFAGPTTLPASLPDVTGQPVSDAQSQLEAIKVTVETTSVTDASQPDGTVIAQDPPGGAAYASQVTLTVAHKPVTTYLSDLTPVDGETSATGVVSSDGTQYVHSVSLDVVASDNRYAVRDATVSYDLSKAYGRFTAKLGVSDDSNDAATVTIEIFGDGRSLTSKDVKVGKNVPVDLDVTGVLRLKVVVTSTAPKDVLDTGHSIEATAVLGDATLKPGSATSSTSTTARRSSS